MRATTRLRQLLASTRPLIVPGCYDALSAACSSAAGFPAVYMTGYGTSLALLGLPDAGLATMTEMHLNARYIANAVAVPVIADADNGYGNAINVMRTVREYVQTGVAGIHIEDQAIPKRCGHVAGRRVIPLEEAVGKYRAADAVRRDLDPDFVLIARTDARGAHGGSPGRGHPPGQRLPRGRGRPGVRRGADQRGRDSPRLPGGARADLLQPDRSLAAAHAGRDGRPGHRGHDPARRHAPGRRCRPCGTSRRPSAQEGPAAEARFAERFKGHPVGDLHTFAGFDRIRSWEAAYLPAEELDKYEGSVGHQPTRT